MSLRGLDAVEVVPGLWMGSKPPAGTVVRDAGVSLLVLAGHAREYLPDAPSPRSFVGVQVHHQPLDDNFEAVTVDNAIGASKAAVVVADAVAAGRRVLVTCRLGRNRSGLITALALSRLRPRLMADEIIAIIVGVRPVALENPAFRTFLRGVVRHRKR